MHFFVLNLQVDVVSRGRLHPFDQHGTEDLEFVFLVHEDEQHADETAEHHHDDAV